MSEPCGQEARIAVIETHVSDMKDDLKAILEAVKGNGKPGLSTQVALLDAAQGRIWWAVSGVGAGVIGVVAWIGRGLLGGQ